MHQGRSSLALALSLLVLAAGLAGCLRAEPTSQADEPEPVAPTQDPGVDRAGDAPPTAAFDFSPASPTPGDIVVFVDRSTDPDDGVAGRVWQFPDGTTSQLARANYSFAKVGEYRVRLTVSDRAGHTDMTERVVRVSLLPEAPPLASARPHVVVALVDTGVNPYHEIFRDPAWTPPSAWLEDYPLNATPLPLTLGTDYAASLDKDEALWSAVEVGKLYYVPGTRLVGLISLGASSFANAAANTHPILDDDGHGSCTSSRVAIAAPDVDIVMVETGPDELDDAIRWAGAQPWIAIVSVSIGPTFNLPAQWPGSAGDANPSKAAWDSGKLVFAAAGNEPTLSGTGYISGPSWVVSVGGALPEDAADPATASKGMDIVSDYRPACAVRDSADAMEPKSGTSFSAPTAAGAVGEALFEVRVSQGWTRGIAQGSLLAREGPGLVAGGLSNAELRLAMQAVARYWDTAQWSAALPSLPIAPAPWVQMGWGYVGAEEAPALAQAVLTGELPAKPGEAATYQDAMLAIRASMWG
jgi:PKD repeat protein